MTQPNLQFIPLSETHGGSKVGNTYVNTYALCPRQWAYRFIVPYFRLLNCDEQPTDFSLGDFTGMSPHHTAPSLLTGSDLHEGLEGWYKSGCRDGEDTGEYKLDAAIAAAESHHAKRDAEWLDTDEGEKAILDTKQLLVSYHECYGPQAQYPDFPDIRIACDPRTGAPLIEREFTIPLGDTGYILTSKLDAVIITDDVRLSVFEHKSSAPGFVKQRLRQFDYDPQATTELMALHTNLEDCDVWACKANVLIKGWGQAKKSKFTEAALRQNTYRTPEDFVPWMADVIHTLREIDKSVEAFRRELAAGRPWVEALYEIFPERGRRTGNCFAYNRPCDFWDMCFGHGLEDQSLLGYRARSKSENQVAMERSQ